jgi:hypothetical protein
MWTGGNGARGSIARFERRAKRGLSLALSIASVRLAVDDRCDDGSGAIL